ncbi:ESAG-like protein [Trypanosoma conorhini]|uniref:ESAG-like protein n=1 Tax=Trypanosoma conorhini TaxID=83891 RepID=A0A422QBE2_9TRYP|nr:ESAG-like protein [Trypanosoma conorhini]RNF27226.1 ESAG-like protein [Trypanosoma conorhini]
MCAAVSSTYRAPWFLFLILLLFVAPMQGAAGVAASPALRVGQPRASPRSPLHVANITLAAEEAFFTNTIPLALPLVQRLVLNLTIPPQQTDKFDVAAIHFTEFGLGGASFAMRSPNQLALSLRDMNVTIPDTAFVIKAGLLTCDGEVRAFADVTGAELSVKVSRLSNGTLRLKTAANTIEWGNLQIKHKLVGSVCNGIEKLIEIILGDLDRAIGNALKKQLPDTVGTLVEEKANDFFDSLPVTFVEDPSISAERMMLAMNPIHESKAKLVSPSVLLPFFVLPLPPTSAAPVMPRRNLAAAFTELALNDLLTSLSRSGVFNQSRRLPSEYNSSLIEYIYPDAYKLCPDCPFVFSIDSTAPPSVLLQSGQAVTLHVPNGFVGLTMTSPSGDSIAVLDVLVNFTGGVTGVGFTAGAQLDLRLTEVDLAIEVVQTHIGPVDADALSDTLRWLLNEVLIPVFNVEFHGIPLPPNVVRPSINISTEGVVAGFDVER